MWHGSAPGVLTASSRASASALQRDVARADVLLEMRDRARARNQQRVRRVGQQPRQPDLGRCDAEFAGDRRAPPRCRRPWGSPGTTTPAGSTAPRRCPRPCRLRASPPGSGRAGCRRSARRRCPRAARAAASSSGTLLMPIAPILPSSRSAIISASWSSRSTIWSPSACRPGPRSRRRRLTTGMRSRPSWRRSSSTAARSSAGFCARPAVSVVAGASRADLADDDEVVGVGGQRRADPAVHLAGAVERRGVDVVDAEFDGATQHRGGVVGRRLEQLHGAVADAGNRGRADAADTAGVWFVCHGAPSFVRHWRNAEDPPLVRA